MHPITYGELWTNIPRWNWTSLLQNLCTIQGLTLLCPVRHQTGEW